VFKRNVYFPRYCHRREYFSHDDHLSGIQISFEPIYFPKELTSIENTEIQIFPHNEQVFSVFSTCVRSHSDASNEVIQMIFKSFGCLFDKFFHFFSAVFQ